MNRTNFWYALLICIPFTLSSQEPPELMGITSKGGLNNSGVIYSLTPDGQDFKIRHSFGQVSPYGLNGGITLASDGKIYGATHNGGDFLAGSLYNVNPDGSEFNLIHSFTEDGGNQPFNAPIESSNGLFYGTTSIGGDFNLGIIYSVEKSGDNFTVLHHFGESNGANPIGSLLESADGFLYGLANKGGDFNDGTLYRIQKDGSDFELVHSFDGITDGRYPFGALIEDSEGMLYGCLSAGGPSLGGSVFKMDKDSFDILLLREYGFTIDDGNFPFGTLMEGSDGKIYGNTSSGGADFVGVLFSMNKDGSDYEVIHEFSPTKGRSPYYGNQLLEGSDNVIYGTTFRGGNKENGVVYKINMDGSDFGVLYEFQEEGILPYAGLIELNDKLIGTTSAGGDSDGGTIFSINKTDTAYQNIYDFSRTNQDGFFPTANLIQASDEKVYGHTTLGGEFGYGAIFTTEFDGSGFNVIYHFEKSSGSNPTGALLEASDGFFYGNASEGGDFNNGVVFRFDSESMDYDILHTFSDIGEIGAVPRGSLIESNDGKLYGVAQSGGVFGAGTIFRLNKNGSEMEAIHHFESNGNTGRTPLYQLFESADGKLYGITIFGGSTAANEDGTLFRLDKDGNNFEILKLFNAIENGIPSGPLVSNDDGYLYGTTTSGGINKVGTIYRISMSNGAFETILDFDVVNGISPQGKLLPSPVSDWIYGVARRGGANDEGLVFRLMPDGSNFEPIHVFDGTMDSGAWPDGGLLWRVAPVFVENNFPKLQGISISPNPSNGPVQLILDNESAFNSAELIVMDGVGKTVLRKEGNADLLNQTLKMQSTYWTEGTYFVSVKTGSGFFSGKVVISK